MPKAGEGPIALASSESIARRQEFVVALKRCLSMIRCFDPDHRRMALSEVAGRMGLSKGPARRLLLTLQSLGYVTSDKRLF
jgi:IclR family pca regulon transcriptional regulator